MLIDNLRQLFSRDLNKLHSEIQAYRSEEVIWKKEKEIPNSAGNLCLHLIGNLNTFIGRELGGTGYVRNREAEFSLKDVPRAKLLDNVRKTIDVVDRALSTLDEKALNADYPVKVFEETSSIGGFLIHLAMHLGYHLGQINYHRRLLDVDVNER